ncbi:MULTISPECIES: hypothetical protein [Brevibacillus]|uniref:hypothetical protein n=1 Tax=Brevibacillus TaxID=55080 RepID=UPI0020413092|nr:MULTISPECIES: hypothetical protein [Brevibacillus]MCM3080430.1 hypothetical protein [Brevibacillus invocatus]MCM3430648.1 hypothetical protein [Brevibacillus invocatus]MDH4618886.1 hypothetical protein [Brevibacillus sp. AY1]
MSKKPVAIESPFAAMREVKSLLADNDEAFLVYSGYSEEFYVLEDEYDVGELIGNHFDRSGYDIEAEKFMKEYKILQYVDSDRVSKYPILFEKAEQSKLHGGKSYHRSPKEAGCEYSVSFHIAT